MAKTTSTRGPLPKRSSESAKHRTADEKPNKVSAAGSVAQPAADPTWCAQARAWYGSLAESGQSRYFEPSDWAYAQIVAAMVTTLFDEPSAALMNAVSTAMADLGTTEGARRRMRIEVEREKPPSGEVIADVSDRFRLLAGGDKT